MLLLHGLGATGGVWRGLGEAYGTCAEAVDRFLRVSGLAGLVDAADPVRDDAVGTGRRRGRGVAGGWRRTRGPSASVSPT